ncbi:hypothetical protein LEP1GSC175_1746 [Leptospira santarosai str. HAI821]|uniref:Uncharacterized protein n=1 Tax=Leptospira santarosai str. ZUN179 TaxID=1049985 RepID=M6UXH4_9LEPT|nr:hypothetical protein LEP1GSC169_2295 [Leptospira santarosai str. HAI1349]EMO15752.1 hypothetical protein LEP1GSC165_0812 [Leptospira santarosai str. CBC523]EMO33997.1 hypothetical protein LEP1GSC175_1746 [Leptospira santarosai str. HAI821]EMO45719.1 hypothetical protein LEP1GSC187_1448 [Leptospira santarosai str. ZUN179]
MRFKNILFLLTTKTPQNNTISLFKKLERSISQRKTINFEIDYNPYFWILAKIHRSF